ncbi:hypothetical protein [Bartonella sp. CL63NXGY]
MMYRLSTLQAVCERSMVNANVFVMGKGYRVLMKFCIAHET